MLLSELMQGIDVKNNYSDTEISCIVTDSRKIEKDCAFVCIKGKSFDAHTVAGEAAQKGAAAVIAAHETDAPNTLIVGDTACVLSLMCSNYYGKPSRSLKLIGVTGTNGKTSVTHMIKRILEHSGKRVGLLGTVNYMSGGSVISPASLTTPEALDLHRTFKNMVDSGCEYCVMEVSSQALAQKRCAGLKFDVAAFTNLTQDHLDYHGTMENYAIAKSMLFTQSKAAVFNFDDEYCAVMTAKADRCKKTFFSVLSEDADFYAYDFDLQKDSCRYTLTHEGEKYEVNVGIPGKFTVYNSMTAVAVCLEAGVSIDSSLSALAKMKGVPGRAEVLKTNTPYTVIVDYAHSPDALVNILKSVRTFAIGRVIALFGCGGDRDKSKRPLMAKAAVENADYVIITSDNPRTENPNSIIEDIIPGISGKNTPCAIIPDRTHAIEYSLKNARKDDVIVLCGKGHETYQIIGTEKIHYDEREIVKNALEKYNS